MNTTIAILSIFAVLALAVFTGLIYGTYIVRQASKKDKAWRIKQFNEHLNNYSNISEGICKHYYRNQN